MTDRKALRIALSWLLGRTHQLLQNAPVRDMDECIAHAESVLIKTKKGDASEPHPPESDTVRDEGIPDDIEWKRCPSNKEASLLSEAVRKLQHIIENVVKEPDGYSVRTHAVEFFMEIRDILARAAELDKVINQDKSNSDLSDYEY